MESCVRHRQSCSRTISIFRIIGASSPFPICMPSELYVVANRNTSNGNSNRLTSSNNFEYLRLWSKLLANVLYVPTNHVDIKFTFISQSTSSILSQFVKNDILLSHLNIIAIVLNTLRNTLLSTFRNGCGIISVSRYERFFGFFSSGVTSCMSSYWTCK